MRAFAFVLLLAGCSTPFVPFDEGHDVHVILVVSTPRKVEPVCTVGSETIKPPWRRLRGTAEVATIRVRSGSYRVSVWEGLARSGARGSVRVDRDLWLVARVRPGRNDGGLTVHDQPPRDIDWLPLVAVPR